MVKKKRFIWFKSIQAIIKPLIKVLDYKSLKSSKKPRVKSRDKRFFYQNKKLKTNK